MKKFIIFLTFATCQNKEYITALSFRDKRSREMSNRKKEMTEMEVLVSKGPCFDGIIY